MSAPLYLPGRTATGTPYQDLSWHQQQKITRDYRYAKRCRAEANRIVERALATGDLAGTVKRAQNRIDRYNRALAEHGVWRADSLARSADVAERVILVFTCDASNEGY